QAVADDLLLVVGRDDDADSGPLGRLTGSTGTGTRDLAEKPQEPGIPEVGVRQQGERAEREGREEPVAPREHHGSRPPETTCSHRAANCRATSGQANFSSTSWRPAAPSAARRPGFSRSDTTARANASDVSARR